MPRTSYFILFAYCKVLLQVFSDYLVIKLINQSTIQQRIGKMSRRRFLWLHGKSIIQTLLRRRCKNIECIFRYKTITLFIAYVVLGCPHGLLSIFTWPKSILNCLQYKDIHLILSTSTPCGKVSSISCPSYRPNTGISGSSYLNLL